MNYLPGLALKAAARITGMNEQYPAYLCESYKGQSLKTHILLSTVGEWGAGGAV
jgi:hypothetical protein